jgi:glycosyltransferase involved in cell wall biosynthesis
MPLVSCLCVTFNRSNYLKKATQCFLSQTHKNSELVIVCDSRDFESISFLAQLQSSRIRVFPQEEMSSKTLGELRNIAITHATGDYVCNWDDDDWSNIDRIDLQLDAIHRHKKPACILSRLFIFDEVSNEGFLSYRRMWENTIMVNRNFIVTNKIRYPHINSHEDYQFVNSIIQANALYPLEDATLYIYRYTGKNTCSKAHFDRLFGYSFGLSAYQNLVISNAFSDNVSVEETAKRMHSINFQASLVYVPHVEDRP